MPLPDHKLIVCGIPELSDHSMAGVSHVLSIIDMHEPVPPALGQFSGIDHELIRFDDVVAEYPGFEACTPGHIEQLLAFGERAHARAGSHILVHCHAGISRSQAAAAILMCQHAPGRERRRRCGTRATYVFPEPIVMRAVHGLIKHIHCHSPHDRWRSAELHRDASAPHRSGQRGARRRYGRLVVGASSIRGE